MLISLLGGLLPRNAGKPVGKRNLHLDSSPPLAAAVIKAEREIHQPVFMTKGALF